MIEVARNIGDCERLRQWLESVVRQHLKPDVSNYARGRLRAWINVEPTLTKETKLLQSSLQVGEPVWNRLKELIEWDFDFALVTYSGDLTPTGIAPHRDASYADFEAYGLNVSGQTRFSYWMERETFSARRATRTITEDPTHEMILEPGDLVRFNCKNKHASEPGLKRWNINFWKKKTPPAGV